MSEKFQKLDFNRLRFGLLALLLSGLVAWRAQPFVHGNSDALNTIVTVFSILAGFLVAIITIVGDAASLGRASWRRDEYLLRSFKQRLTRHKLMFQVYLVVLALVFIVQIVGTDGLLTVWYERAMLFLATFAFISSLTLPGQLFQERIDQASKQHEANLPKKLKEAIRDQPPDDSA